MNKTHHQYFRIVTTKSIPAILLLFLYSNGSCCPHYTHNLLLIRQTPALFINRLISDRTFLQVIQPHNKLLNGKLSAFELFGALSVIGLIIYLYIANLKNKKLLKFRQDKINLQHIQIKNRMEENNKQNNQLNQLLNEKEWLIKEVHHRVRNNLQIISSLLNIQSSYLDNEHALKAIRDSQNRLQAIAIVHQKLYQSEDLSTINLRVYIQELAQKILVSFHENAEIKFEINLYHAQLDTDQIVPLGLIINEIITNSVKHAFPDNRPGIISLTSSISSDNYYELVIADNGKGLSHEFDINFYNSLGMNLIVGLTRQLGGRVSIKSIDGMMTTVAIPL